MKNGDRSKSLRIKLQKMLNELKYTSTNNSAEKMRSSIMAEIKENKWAAVKITNGKVEVKEIEK